MTFYNKYSPFEQLYVSCVIPHSISDIKSHIPIYSLAVFVIFISYFAEISFTLLHLILALLTCPNNT